ncbi:kinase-like domain-containing protein [Mycena crocata]|nr:kinase-like domain-containing protein [Mycena crocata]
MVSSSPEHRQSPWTTLGDKEQEWARYQPFLAKRGYLLRPRYRRGWTPDVVALGRDPWECEDAIPAQGFDVLDATQISTGAQVVLKVVQVASAEININSFLNDQPEAQNHAVRILEVIQMPDQPKYAFMVMPRLRQCSHPPWFATVREFAEFVQQVLQGLVYLHSQNIAHRDICTMNIVVDASQMIPGGFHFLETLTSNGVDLLRVYTGDDSESDVMKSRTEAGPMNYYFIDFGLSVQFPRFESRELVTGDCGRLRKHVPEISATVPYDPFKADVRLVGEMIRAEFLLNYIGLDFIIPLVKKLRHRDPARRPDAATALALFQQRVERMTKKELEKPLQESFWNKERRAVLFLKGLGIH